MTRFSQFFVSLLLVAVVGLHDAHVAVGQEVDNQGTGSVVQSECSFDKSQLRIDTSSPEGTVCFDILGPGWLRVDVGEVYGAFNNSEFPVKLAFRNNENSVFWQESISAGDVRTLDVDRRRSRVVEIVVGESETSVDAPGKLIEGSAVSFTRNAGITGITGLAALGFDPGATMASAVSINKTSAFEDRLDATFIVRAPLASGDENCFSFESASYPGAFLTAQAIQVQRRFDSSAENATWCLEPLGDSQFHIRSANNTWIGNPISHAVGLLPAQGDNTVWNLRGGLADPR